MDLKIFLTSLCTEEKQELFRLLAPEILEKSVEKLTRIDTFCYEKRHEISTRLKNVLIGNKDWLGEYIETIDSNQIHKFRNASMNTELEFIKLRGF
jgi:hypothetical protein